MVRWKKLLLFLSLILLGFIISLYISLSLSISLFQFSLSLSVTLFLSLRLFLFLFFSLILPFYVRKSLFGISFCFQLANLSTFEKKIFASAFSAFSVISLFFKNSNFIFHTFSIYLSVSVSLFSSLYFFFLFSSLFSLSFSLFITPYAFPSSLPLSLFFLLSLFHPSLSASAHCLSYFIKSIHFLLHTK